MQKNLPCPDAMSVLDKVSFEMGEAAVNCAFNLEPGVLSQCP